MASKVQLTGGNFQDAEGNVLANGYLKFQLSQDGTVSGTANICSGVEVTIKLNVSGAVDTSTPQYIWGNDNISPVNTFYRVTGYTATGQPAWGPNNQQVVGNGTFDVGTWVPNQVFSWSPSATSVLLETNGTKNSSQAVLNLEAGPNVTLTDQGAGAIQISATPSTAFGLAYGGMGLGPCSMSGAPTSSTPSVIYAAQMFLPASVTIRNVTFQQGTGGFTGIVIVFGIYDSTGNSKLLEADYFNGSVMTAGLYQIALGSPVTLQAGVYWFVVGSNRSSVGLAPSVTTQTSNGTLVNLDTTRIGTIASPLAGSAPYLPASLGTITPANVNMPSAFLCT